MSGFTSAIVAWMQSTFHNNLLVTALISVIPMIEVRGAITVGVNLGMNPWVAYPLSCLSALIVCPILILLLKPILKALKKTKWFSKFATAIESLFVDKANKIDDKAEKKVESIGADDAKLAHRKKTWRRTLGIFLFVALPLPMTGVWTGTAVAVFMDLDYRYSVPAIVVGNFVAGLIITLLNVFLKEYSVLILLVLAIFVLITIVGLIVTLVVKRKKTKKQNVEESVKNEK